MSRRPLELWGGIEANGRFDASRRSPCAIRIFGSLKIENLKVLRWPRHCFQIMAVFAGAADSSRCDGCGAIGQSIAFVRPSNTLRVVPSIVTHSAPKQYRKTPPSGLSKEKKFGRRNRFERSEYFFSSASEYCPEKRVACSSLSRCSRVTSTIRLLCFSS